MISALLMMRRLAAALRVALREEDFERVLSAGLALIIVGTLAYSIGGGWSVVDGLYVAVATLTTSSILDPDLTLTDPWLTVFTAGYVLLSIGILVEVACPLGMGFMAARAEVEDGGDQQRRVRRYRPRDVASPHAEQMRNKHRVRCGMNTCTSVSPTSASSHGRCLRRHGGTAATGCLSGRPPARN